MGNKGKVIVSGTTQFTKFRYAGGRYSPVYLGGNGVIASLTASRLANVSLVSVIGTDIKKERLAKLLPGVNIDNVEQLSGETFFYTCTYDRKTQDLHEYEVNFGVYENYIPDLRANTIGKHDYVLFSGSRPQMGLAVIDQCPSRHIAVDTIMYHLQYNYGALIELMAHAEYIFVNEVEYSFLQKRLKKELLDAFPKAQYVFRKKDERGIDVITRRKTISYKPGEVITPKNPTNAGDVVSGIIIGSLAAGKKLESDMEKIITSAQEEAKKILLNDPSYRKELR